MKNPTQTLDGYIVKVERELRSRLNLEDRSRLNLEDPEAARYALLWVAAMSEAAGPAAADAIAANIDRMRKGFV